MSAFGTDLAKNGTHGLDKVTEIEKKHGEPNQMIEKLLISAKTEKNMLFVGGRVL